MGINKKIVLSFDLDNTLINNRKGIVNSFNYALKKYNLPEMKKITILKMIGIPLEEMFASISNLNPSILAKAFREYYGTKGIYQSKLLPDVKKKLLELKGYKFRLGIITSKKQEMAEKIVKYLKIYSFFDFILGETEDRKNLGKMDPKLKEILLNQYPTNKFIIIIIGDHPKDVMLSNNLNCPFIGVLTGNHSAHQLKEYKYGDIIIIKSIKELTIDKIKSLI
ncbi:MAG: HAD family hydrolase [Candidatus Hodarchaeota archaeon]